MRGNMSAMFNTVKFKNKCTVYWWRSPTMLQTLHRMCQHYRNRYVSSLRVGRGSLCLGCQRQMGDGRVCTSNKLRMEGISAASTSTWTLLLSVCVCFTCNWLHVQMRVCLWRLCPRPPAPPWSLLPVFTIQQRCGKTRGPSSLIWRAARRSLAGGWYVSVRFFCTSHTAARRSAILSVFLTYSEFHPTADNTPNIRWATAGRKEIAWPYCLPLPPLCSSQIKGFLINWKVLRCGP